MASLFYVVLGLFNAILHYLLRFWVCDYSLKLKDFFGTGVEYKAGVIHLLIINPNPMVDKISRKFVIPAVLIVFSIALLYQVITIGTQVIRGIFQI
jgi:hypothetical protein